MKRHLHRPTVTTRYYQFHLQTPTNTSKYQQVHLKTSTYKQSYLQGYKKSSPEAISSHQMPTKAPQNDTKVTYKSHQIHLQKPTVTSRNQTIRHFKTKLKSSPNITKATSTYKQIYLQRYKKSASEGINPHQMPNKSPQNDTNVTYKVNSTCQRLIYRDHLKGLSKGLTSNLAPQAIQVLKNTQNYLTVFDCDI